MEIKSKVKEEIDKKKDKLVKAVEKSKAEKEERRRKNRVVKILKWSFLLVLIIVVLIITSLYVYEHYIARQESESFTETTSTIIDTKDIAELQVANVTYNSVATIDKDGNVTQRHFTDKEKKKNVSRYVSYKGEMKVYYDLAKLKIEENKNEEKYIVTVPTPILTPTVINADFNHIILDAKAEKNYSTSETKKLCQKDLEAKFKAEESKIREIADKNFKSVIEAYILVFNDKGYAIEYKYLEEAK